MQTLKSSNDPIPSFINMHSNDSNEASGLKTVIIQ